VKWKDYADEHNSWVEEQDAGYVFALPGLTILPDTTRLFHSGAQELIKEYHSKRKKIGRPRKSLPTPAKPARATSPPESVSVSTTTRKTKSRAQPEPEEDDEEVDEEAEEPPLKSATRSSWKAKPISTVKSGAKKRKVDEHIVEVDLTQHEDMEAHMSKKSWDRLIVHMETVERQDDGDLVAYFHKTNQDANFNVQQQQRQNRKMPCAYISFERKSPWEGTL
jgi:hypothetical protein